MRRWWVLAGIVVLAAGYLARGQVRAAWEAFQKSRLPAAVESVNQSESPADSSGTASPAESAVRTPTAELNLNVPFTSQAPHANWDEDHREFCEEAAVLMAGRYFSKRTIENKDDAEAALQQLKTRELELFGYFKDTTAAETAQLLEDVYAVMTEVIRDPTIDQLKAALAAGRLVLIPAAGRQLGNPNFRRPGPLYHMLVLKGYTKGGKFITNDPGTRKGADYVYPFERVMTAMHDWNNGNVADGGKVAIIVRSQE